MASVITLTTDFGTNNAYVASLKGAIVSVNAVAHIIDISHEIRPQNIRQAAFFLHITHSAFPSGTIHLIVVDPGVGSTRQAIVLKTPYAFFIAPDNGVLSYILDEYCPGIIQSGTVHDNRTSASTICPHLEAVALTTPKFWRNPASQVFHGRDIFAPVAAHLSLGVHLEEFGERIIQLQTLPLPRAVINADGSIYGCVINIDIFGNLVTNIKSPKLAGADYVFTINSSRVKGIYNYYAEMDGLGVVTGSSGYLELSCKDGSAQEQLNASVGDIVHMSTI